MIYGIGTDIIEVDRIKEAIEKYGDKFLKRIFTEIEIQYCELFKDNKFLHYAARFAAKESFSKAIGTGITKGFKFNEIWIQNEPSGKPVVHLAGYLAENYGHLRTTVSLSHTQGNGVAFVIIEE